MKFLFHCIRTLALSMGLAIAGMSAAAVYTAAHAAEKAPIYLEKKGGPAVSGYDVTSYFAGAPVKGSPDFAATHKGATYHFANAANRDRFLAAPERFAPQYGGYCAWAVSQNKLAPGRPQYWKVVSGKLYLNYDAGVQKKWEKDIPGFLAKSEANWPNVLSK